MRNFDNHFFSVNLLSVCRYYGKRSADAEPEAEANPQYYLGGYRGYYGGYGGYGGYRGYGYYGKRSAEGEPEADPKADPKADPALLYGYAYPAYTSYVYPATYSYAGYPAYGGYGYYYG